MKDIPDEARREFTLLQEKLDAAIQRRDEIKRRKEAVSPKIWSMAMRSIKPSERPNLRAANSEVDYIRSQMVALIQKYEGSVKEAVARVQSDAAGDPLHLQKPVTRSRLYGHGIRIGDEDTETDS